ncbi:MAG: Molybdopterin biosynthesis protein MoeA [Ilumatobacteraceae bacterium]|nr:Molybdopterin biosynthesis protein MoeA [Ilumatobacteraceae bacterium]
MAPLFDRYIVVDWSANSVPKTGKDSIWSCIFDPVGGRQITLNHRTRWRARQYLIDELLQDTCRVLIGFDFPYGYPRGFAAAAGLTGEQPWLAAWQHLACTLRDDADNNSNRFEVAAQLNAAISDGLGPFWGTTADRHITPSLSATKAPGFPHAGLAEFRANELAMRATRRYPSSVWQLCGAGSVGSQALTGIPVVWALRSHEQLMARSTVWPFETGLCVDPTGGHDDMIVHAEIWPSAIPLDRSRHPVKDAAQVIGLCEHLARLDALGQLSPQFAPELDGETAHAVVAEEGWILGAHQPQRAGR